MTRVHGIDLDNAAAVERYLSGKGYDATSQSYRYYSGEVRKAYAAHQEQKRREAARLRESLAQLGAPSTPAARRTWSQTFAQLHGITVEERTTMPKGTGGFANWAKRRVVVPPLTDDASFAVRLHEFGHILASDCTQKAPHYRDPKVTEWWHCIQCEADAWRIAMRQMPFTRDMFRRLQSSLASYRRCTPAPASALSTSRQIASDQYYAERVQARADHERRMDAYREIQRIAAEPPVLRRWQKH